VMEGKSEKTKIAWPKNAQPPKMFFLRDGLERVIRKDQAQLSRSCQCREFHMVALTTSSQRCHALTFLKYIINR